MGSDAGLLLLMLAPAVVALGCIALAIYLARQPVDDEGRGTSVVRIVAIVLLSLLAFGIGCCYAVVFVGGNLGG